MREGKVPTTQEIEQRAYEIFVKRGGEEGRSIEDWMAAEKELTELSKEPVSSTPKARSART
jgi:Protein of unknown function (DUF2934)